MAKKKEKLRGTIVKGFGTLIIREFLIKAFSLVGQLFLARLLAPEDFGIYVIVVFIVTLVGFFSDIGLSFAIIQKKAKPKHDELSSIFNLKVFLALFLIVTIWFTAPLIVSFYPNFSEANALMVRVLSFTLLLTAIKSIPIAILERNLRYDRVSLLDVIGIIIFYIVSIPAAVFGLGVWSFVIGALSKDLVETVAVYIMKPFMPSFIFRLDKIRRMVRFGLFIQANNLATFAISSITPVIGGTVLGPYSVGLLDFANKVTSFPGVIAMNFARVAFAGYSRIQDQKELLFRSIDKSISMLSILIYFFPAVIFAFGQEIISTFYTEKWLPALPALYILSISSFVHPINSALGQGILSIGKSKDIFKATVIAAVIGWILALSLIGTLGFAGIAASITLVSIISGVFYVHIFKRLGYELPFKSIIFPKILVFILTFVFCLLLDSVVAEGIMLLLFKISVSGLFYLVLSYIFGKEEILELFSIVKSIILNKND